MMKKLHSKYELTKRELEILDWVIKGLSNPQIAKISHISKKTVENHLNRIYSKLGVSNRTQAGIVALARGLTSLKIDELIHDIKQKYL